MPYEELTTVQTVAKDQTEVATKTNTLLSDYKIATDDIKSHSVAPFGANQFIISVIYLLRYVEILSQHARVGLTPLVKRSITKNKSIRTLIGEKVLVIRTKTFGRILRPLEGIANPLITVISDTVTYRRGLGPSTLGAVLLSLWEFTKTPLTLLIGNTVTMAKAVASVRPNSNLVGLFIDTAYVYNAGVEKNRTTEGLLIDTAAEYNGVPIIPF